MICLFFNKVLIIHTILIKLFLSCVKGDYCEDYYCYFDEQCREDCLLYHQSLDYYYRHHIYGLNTYRRGLHNFSPIGNHNMNSGYCGHQNYPKEVSSFASPKFNDLGRIMGGVDAKRFEFPWIVSFQKLHKDKYRHFCAGTIINDFYILTAAHCFEKYVGKESMFLIRIGANNIEDSKEGVSIKAAKIIVHQQYDRNLNLNDIALFRIDGPIQFSADEKSGAYAVNSICLPQPMDELPEEAVIAGWGQIAKDGPSATILQKLFVPKFPIKSCQQNYASLASITDLMTCYGGVGEQDSCMGDSGGPLMEKRDDKYYLIGIVSFGLPCAKKTYPTIYTKVSKYLDWIEKHAIN